MNLDAYLARFQPRRRRVVRPVEDELLAREAEPGRRRFWQRVEHEILNILVATGGSKCKADRLRRYAQVVVGRLQGMTNAAVALTLSLPIEEVAAILERARARLQAFLAQSPLMQGLVLARGALRVFWAEEVTPAVLNGGRKFVAVLPHGTYHVRYHAGRAYVQAAQKAAGRVRTRMVTLGAVGTLTTERLLAGTRELQAKLEALPAA